MNEDRDIVVSSRENYERILDENADLKAKLETSENAYTMTCEEHEEVLGCVKHELAETKAKLAQMTYSESAFEKLSVTLDLRTRERDECCKESKRTSQKWMDGLRELFGKDIDFDDPCSGRTLDDWVRKKEKELATLRGNVEALSKALDLAGDERDKLRETAKRRKELLGSVALEPTCAWCHKNGLPDHQPDCPLAKELEDKP